MSDLSLRVTTLVDNIKSLEGQLVQQKAELKALTGDLNDQLRIVKSLTGQRVIGSGVRVGRPRGPVAEGELSVSKQVLNYLASREDGATRSEILANVPAADVKERRDSAVHAAIRVHQQAGKVFNKDHRWFYNTAAVEQVEVEPEVAATVTE